jgi:hypothetical protein
VSSDQRPQPRRRRAARLLRLGACCAGLGALTTGQAVASGPAPLPAPTTPHATHTYVAPGRSYVPVRTGPTTAQIAAARAAARAAVARTATIARRRRLHRLAVARAKARARAVVLAARRRERAARAHRLHVLAALAADRDAQARFSREVYASIGGAAVAAPAGAPELPARPPSTSASFGAPRAVGLGVSGALLVAIAGVTTVRVLRRPRHTAAHP